jgi:hypothetical protein
VDQPGNLKTYSDYAASIIPIKGEVPQAWTFKVHHISYALFHKIKVNVG